MAVAIAVFLSSALIWVRRMAIAQRAHCNWWGRSGWGRTPSIIYSGRWKSGKPAFGFPLFHPPSPPELWEFLSLAHADSVSPTAGRAIDHIAFEIKDLESFCKKLAADGIKFDSPYQVLPQLKLSTAFLTDPSGTRIELTEGLAH